MCDDGLQNFIDFNSPLKLRPELGEITPLVPLPEKLENSEISCNENILLNSFDGNNSVSDDNNPFDLVDHQKNLNERMLNDPFELVYQKAFILPQDAKESSPKCTNEYEVERMEGCENCRSVSPSDFSQSMERSMNDQSLGLLNLSFYNKGDSSLFSVDGCTDLIISIPAIDSLPEANDLLIPVIKSNCEGLNNANGKENAFPSGTRLEGREADSLVNGCANNSDEELKTMVAGRVSICIQNALQQSRSTITNNFVHDLTPETEHPIFHSSRKSSLPLNKSFAYLSATGKTSTPECVEVAKSAQEKNDSDDMNKLKRNSVSRFELTGGLCTTKNWNSEVSPLEVGIKSTNGDLNDGFYASRSSETSHQTADTKSTNIEFNEVLCMTKGTNSDMSHQSTDIKTTNSPSHSSLSFIQKAKEKLKKFKKQRMTSEVDFTSERKLHSVLDSDKEYREVSQITSGETEDCGNAASEIQLQGSEKMSSPTDDNFDDSVFLEANRLSFIFKSFTQPACEHDDDDDDIHSCKPPWETSKVEFPRLSSEEEEEENNPIAEIQPEQDECKKMNSGHKQENEDSPNGGVQPEHDECKKIASDDKQKNDAPNSRKVTSKLDIRAVKLPNIDILPLLPITQSAENDLRLKPKLNNPVGKKGPLKATVPFGNMMCLSGDEIKGSKNSSEEFSDRCPTQQLSKPNIGVSKGLPKAQILLSKPSKGIGDVLHRSFESEPASTKGFGNLSLTSPCTAPLQVSKLRRANSLTSGTPLLASPAKLNEKGNSYTTTSSGPSTPSSKNISFQMMKPKSRSSTGIPQLDLSGLVATSTPARSLSNLAPRSHLPSPIAVKTSNAKVLYVDTSMDSLNTNNISKNRSFDGTDTGKQEKERTILQHGRSKSASNMKALLQSKKNTQITGRIMKKEVFTQNKSQTSYNARAQPGILKPRILNGNNNNKPSPVNKPKLANSVPSNDQRKKSVTQLFSKLRTSSLPQLDKENLKPQRLVSSRKSFN